MKLLFIIFFLLTKFIVFAFDESLLMDSASIKYIQQNSDTTFSSHFTGDSKMVFFFIGGSFQKQLVGEIGVTYCYSGCVTYGRFGRLKGTKISTEFNFDPNNFFLAPKLTTPFWSFIIFPFTYKYNLFFGTRFNFIDYTDFFYHDLKFTPEIGFQLFQRRTNLMYGYNIPLTDSKIENIGTHRLTLIFTL